MNHKHLAALLTLTLTALPGCNTEADPGGDAGPEGPVASNAAEAWPDAPTGVAAVTPARVAAACAEAGRCGVEAGQFGAAEAVSLMDLCAFDAEFSAERAIPWSGYLRRQARVEAWVACLEAAAGDCVAADACSTERDDSLYCEEDGCRSTLDDTPTVTCAGTVATVTHLSREYTRDCALAFAECDPASATGCTDRHFTACPDDAVTRCEGDVLLGCDAARQVSWHDCSRLGGACVDQGGGSAECVYPEQATACAEGAAQPAACSGADLAVCVAGQRVTLAASPLCQ